MNYGDVVRLQLGPKSFYLVNHPDYIKSILQDNYKNFVKGYDLVEPVTGRGLLISEGEFWKRQRKLIQPAFHRQKIAALIYGMTQNIDAHLCDWQKNVDSGEPLDIEAQMFKITRYNLVRTLFGFEMGDEVDKAGEAFEVCLEYLQALMKAPFKVMTYLPTRTNFRFRKARKVLDRLVYSMLEKKKNSGAEGSDLFSMLLREQSIANDTMTDKELRDEVMTLFITGHETTATALTWVWYLLDRHPEVLTKLHNEIQQMLGSKLPVAEDLPELKYTNMVIDETLRLYPSTWLFARQPLTDFSIGGYTVPKSAMVFLSPYVMHRHPEYWQNPDLFQPERFENGQEGRHPFVYFPFSGGPRNCVGAGFAISVIKLVIVMVLQRFDLKRVTDEEIKPAPKATLRPGAKLWMRVKQSREA